MSEGAMTIDAGLFESLGREIVERCSALNVLTAALLAGALVADRVLSLRMRASLRVWLYAPMGLRILLPLDWKIPIGRGLDTATLLVPLLQLGSPLQSDSPASHALSWHAVLAPIYVLIAGVLAGHAVLARLRIGRALGNARAVLVPQPDVPCAVVAHDDLGPMVVGVLAPRIVLPRRLLVAGEERALACVLRHEAAHLRRRDEWLSLAMQLLSMVAWPVVPLWVAAARVRYLMELACDEVALAGANSNERRTYGHTLLEMAEWRSFAVAPMGAGELHFGSTLRARIEAIASQRRWPLAAQAASLAFSTVVLFMVGGGLASASGVAPAGSKSRYGYEFAPDSPDGAAEPSPSPAPSSAAPPNPKGRLAPESIQSTVREQFDAIRRCYDAGQETERVLAGQIVVKFVVGEDGVPHDVVNEESALSDNEVIRCVLGVFRDLRFEASHDGGVNVMYPIVFTR